MFPAELYGSSKSILAVNKTFQRLGLKRPVWHEPSIPLHLRTSGPVRSVIRTVTPQQQLDRLPNIPLARPNPLVRPPMVSNSRALFRSPTEERPVVSTSVSGVMTVTLQNVAIHFPTPKSVELDYEDEEPFLKVTFESLTGQHANLCPDGSTRSYPLNLPDDQYW